MQTIDETTLEKVLTNLPPVIHDRQIKRDQITRRYRMAVLDKEDYENTTLWPQALRLAMFPDPKVADRLIIAANERERAIAFATVAAKDEEYKRLKNAVMHWERRKDRAVAELEFAENSLASIKLIVSMRVRG